MTCPQCKNEIPEGAFCDQCGHSFGGAAPAYNPAPAGDPQGTVMSAGPAKSLLAGKYELVAEIGRGGMGIIYKALNTKLGRHEAIKKLKEEIRVNKADKERFLKEARTVAQLEHPNIVRIYDVFEEAGDVYLAFEYVDGITLAQYLGERAAAVTWQEARPLILEACSAMEHAHARGIIHRDLKPANIMLTADKKVKVMDFGIAREAKNTVLRHTGVDTSGTLLYMAPEQHIGDGDGRSDIYAMGITIYELLTGSLPFKGADLYEAKKRMAYRPAGELNPDLPSGVNELINKCLAYSRDARFGSFSEILKLVETS